MTPAERKLVELLARIAYRRIRERRERRGKVTRVRAPAALPSDGAETVKRSGTPGSKQRKRVNKR